MTRLAPKPTWRRALLAHWSLAELSAAAACVIAWTGWMWLTAGQGGWRIWAANASLVLSFTLWGRVLLVGLGIDQIVPRGFLFPLLTGALMVPFVVAACRLLTPIGLLPWYAIVVGLGLALYALAGPRIARWRPLDRGQWRELGGVLLALVAVTFWIRHLSPLVIVKGDASQYRPFIEFFFHTTHATPLLIDGSPVVQGSFQFAGVPLAYYHYASYALPALVAWIGNCAVYDAMVGSWYPVGYFLLGAAGWVLGDVLFGRRAALWCLAAVLLVPDPSFWCTPIEFYSLNAFAEASPALSYASAAAALAISLMTLAGRWRRMLLVAAAFAVAGATVFFKANVVVAAMPLCGLYFLALWNRFASPAKWIALAMLVGLGMLGLAAGTRLRSAPTIGLDPEWGRAFTQYVLKEKVSPDSCWQQLYEVTKSPLPWMSAPARFALIACVTFQMMLLPLLASYLACAWLWPSARALRRLLLAAVLIYLFSAICLPANANGDPYELQHRAFFWVYFLCAVWTAGVCARLLRGICHRPDPGFVVACILLCVPLVLGRELRIAPVDDVPTGLVRAARYVLTHGPTTDIVQDAENDPQLILAALSQRRAYLCISLDETFPGSGVLHAVHAGRAAECGELLKVTTRAELVDFARRTGVRWFVLHPDTNVTWPTDVVAQPSFADRGFRVYDLTRIAGEESP